MRAYIHTCSIRPDGTKDSFLTRELPVKESPLEWQKLGLQFTASGYGSRIPTAYMVQLNGRWRRVYCRIYSNNGTFFIGRRYDGSNTVDIWR